VCVSGHSRWPKAKACQVRSDPVPKKKEVPS
jgi:hypothetical protein